MMISCEKVWVKRDEREMVVVNKSREKACERSIIYTTGDAHRSLSKILRHTPQIRRLTLTRDVSKLCFSQHVLSLNFKV
jgi:hypothetical protein